MSFCRSLNGTQSLSGHQIVTLVGGGWRATATRLGLEMQCYILTTDEVLDVCNSPVPR